LFKLLSCCSKELGVQDLARIAASSKSLREACIAIARRDMLQLLEAAVAQAAAAAAAMAADSALNSSSYDKDDDIFPEHACAYCIDNTTEAQTAYERQVHAVAWLLRAAPAEAASDAAVECVLLRLPAVSQQTAVQLVTAGMRVPFAQLLSAAHSMVKGVEVWVLAQQQLGVQTDIPQDAVDICMGSFSVFKRWVSRSDWATSMVPGIQ
jgi:hypothetical protein